MDRRTLILVALAVAAWWFFFREPAAEASDPTGVGTSSGGNSGNSVLGWLRELLGLARQEERVAWYERPRSSGLDAFERFFLDPTSSLGFGNLADRRAGGGFPTTICPGGSGFSADCRNVSRASGSFAPGFVDAASYGGIFGSSYVPGPRRE
jgi:hypothetical protein